VDSDIFLDEAPEGPTEITRALDGVHREFQIRYSCIHHCFKFIFIS
jgi:hypothetical protein